MAETSSARLPTVRSGRASAAPLPDIGICRPLMWRDGEFFAFTGVDRYCVVFRNPVETATQDLGLQVGRSYLWISALDRSKAIISPKPSRLRRTQARQRTEVGMRALEKIGAAGLHSPP